MWNLLATLVNLVLSFAHSAIPYIQERISFPGTVQRISCHSRNMEPSKTTSSSIRENPDITMTDDGGVSVAARDLMSMSGTSQAMSETDDNSNDSAHNTISAGGANASPATSYNSHPLDAPSVLPLNLPTSNGSSHQGPLPSIGLLLNETRSIQVTPRHNQTLPAMILPSRPLGTPQAHIPLAPPGELPAPWSFQLAATSDVLHHQPQGPTAMFSPVL